MLRKKGVSGVVTAVLLILLVIAVISILFIVIRDFVNSGTGEVPGTSDCLLTSFEFVSADSGVGSATIQRTGGDAELGSIKIVVGTESIDVDSGDENPGVGDTSTASGFTLSSGNAEASVVFTLSDGKSCPLYTLGSVSVQ